MRAKESKPVPGRLSSEVHPGTLREQFKSTLCVQHFVGVLTKSLTTSHLKEEGFILAHSLAEEAEWPDWLEPWLQKYVAACLQLLYQEAKWELKVTEVYKILSFSSHNPLLPARLHISQIPQSLQTAPIVQTHEPMGHIVHSSHEISLAANSELWEINVYRGIPLTSAATCYAKYNSLICTIILRDDGKFRTVQNTYGCVNLNTPTYII